VHHGTPAQLHHYYCLHDFRLSKGTDQSLLIHSAAHGLRQAYAAASCVPIKAGVSSSGRAASNDTCAIKTFVYN
jgi:hypothetical protein